MTSPNEWPQDRTATLVGLWKAGKSAGDIARTLNITRNMVMGKVSRLGMQRGRAVNYSPSVSKPHEKRPPTPLKPQAAKGKPIPFLAAGPLNCRWPLWSGPKTGKVCGATPVPSKPYCPYHYDLAYVELWARRRAP